MAVETEQSVATYTAVKDFTDWAAPQTSVGIYYPYTSSKERVSNGDWRAFFRDHGYLPASSYRRNIRNVSIELGRIESQSRSTGKTLSVLDHMRILEELNNAQVPLSTDPRVLSYYQECLTRQYQKVQDLRVQTAETLVELNKTRSMFLDVARRTAKALLLVRKGKLRGAASALGYSNAERRNFVDRSASRLKTKTRFADQVANDWLAFRYGWTPLYSSVYESMRLVHDRIQRDQNIERVVSTYPKRGTPPDYTFFSRTNGVNNSEYGTGTAPIEFGSITRVTEFSRSDEISWTMTWIVQLVNDQARLANQLGIANPVAIAWELVPFSFVADWFVNVGDVLNSLCAFFGKRLIVGSETLRLRTQLTGRHTKTYWDIYGPDTVRVPVAANGHADILSVNRTILHNPPAIDLRLNNDLNPKRVTDAAALIKQLVQFR